MASHRDTESVSGGSEVEGAVVTRDNRSLVNTGQQDTGACLATSWLDHICLFEAEFSSPIGIFPQLLSKNQHW